jgi:ABC-type sugar transport system ATPase subunit
MSLTVRNVSLSYGSTDVLRECSLDAAQGELVCLVGPSGCGKTSLLNVIAGVLQGDHGSVEVGGRPVDRLPTRERNIAFIMDRLGLYPHLSVFENIAYPLKIRKLPSETLFARVEAVCGETGLAGLEKRRPHELSAGQQQRVAIARALVRDDAALLLADECFSNLDAQLRYELRSAFRRWQRDRGVTSLFVTHDQEEALSLGDRVLLMRSGQIVQAGTATELYKNPQTLFAATFFGVPRCNVVPMASLDGKPTRFGNLLSNVRPDLLPADAKAQNMLLAFRPEAVHLVEASARDSVSLRVEWHEHAGADSILHLAGDGNILTARTQGSSALDVGRTVAIHIEPSAMMVFDEVTGQRVG